MNADISSLKSTTVHYFEDATDRANPDVGDRNLLLISLNMNIMRLNSRAQIKTWFGLLSMNFICRYNRKMVHHYYIADIRHGHNNHVIKEIFRHFYIDSVLEIYYDYCNVCIYILVFVLICFFINQAKYILCEH